MDVEDDYDLGLPKRNYNEVQLYEHSKAINCYDLEGNFIKTFLSLTKNITSQ